VELDLAYDLVVRDHRQFEKVRWAIGEMSFEPCLGRREGFRPHRPILRWHGHGKVF